MKALGGFQLHHSRITDNYRNLKSVFQTKKGANYLQLLTPMTQPRKRKSITRNTHTHTPCLSLFNVSYVTDVTRKATFP